MAAHTAEALALARHYLEIGNDVAALDALGTVGGAELEAPEYWYIRTTALRGLDRLHLAADAARTGLELDPDNIALLDSLALAELGRDGLAEAERALARALESAPQLPGLHAHMALTLAKAGRTGEAWAHVDRALELAPDDVQALRACAQVAYAVHEDPEAVRAYVAEVLRVAPNDQIAHAILGWLSAREKDYRRSSAELAEAMRIDPGNQKLAAGARQVRVLAHPLLAPVRPMWKFGRRRTQLAFVAAVVGLDVAHHTTLGTSIAVVWVMIVVLSRVALPILRRREERRYGG